MAQRVILAVLATLLLGLQWRLWVANGGIAHTHRLKGEVAQQAAENESLRASTATHDPEVQHLNSGVVAIEGRARTKMGMRQEGEAFYLVFQRCKDAREEQLGRATVLNQ